MLTASLHQRTASTFARRAQIAFVTLGIGATALAAFALRTPPPVETPSLSVPVPPSGKFSGSGKSARGGDFDATGIDKRLRQIANYPSPADKPEEEVVKTTLPPPVPDETVKFLGTLSEPTRRVALLRIGEHQRLLGPGESDGDVTVVDVTDDHVEITLKGSITQTLNKQARAGSTINFVTSTAPPPNTLSPMDPGSGAANGGPGGRGKRGPLGRGNIAGEDAATIAERFKARSREAGGEKP